MSRADLVKGFVIAKNQYVLLDKQDIESVKLESRHARCNDASETVVPPERGWREQSLCGPAFLGSIAPLMPCSKRRLLRAATFVKVPKGSARRLSSKRENAG
ncbi:hypothetical protein [Bradyrhizobium sp. sBnM-33]|uniref:hypothetical protein n=1 Tax=Bradyrhizobium sp. sBnM-33 TaxID=2831780 RepID=UPI001BCF6F38|nr:hypothetical protein [Bradyrhizobium sp. sBnM-33]WOH53778.1 hypothetical protein RX328_17810 [Bradyrhizobium sp. sBnM-33]